MSWLRIEGRMPQHHKVAPLTDGAFRLHITAMAWSVEGKTDGNIPKAIPATLTRAPQGKKLSDALRELTASGVWVATDKGYAIHDFLQWNLSAADIAARSDAKARAGASGGRRSGEARQKQSASNSEAPASTSQAPASSVLQIAAKTSEAKPKPLSQSLPKTQSGSTDDADPKDLTGSGDKYPLVSAAAAGADQEFQDKCRTWLRSPATASIEGAAQHPKILQIAHAWCRPFGVDAVRMTDNPAKSADLAAIVQAFAAGYTLQELERVAELAPNDEWVKGIKVVGGGGPSVFSLKVIEGILRPGTIRGKRPREASVEQPPVDPSREAAAQQRLAREAERERAAIAQQTAEARARLAANGGAPDAEAPPALDLAALAAGIG